jgi:MFS family permease
MTRTLRPPAIVLIYAARAVRGFGDGFAVILLPVYLSALGYGAPEVGLIATAALLGSAATTLGVGMLARRHPLRRLLLTGAATMVATGLLLPAFEPLALIGAVAFVGTINPSAGDIGMLVPLEHAAIAHEAAADARTRAFARYSLIGALATAAGALAASVPQFLGAQGMPELQALRLMFVVYAVLGILAALLYARLPAEPAAETKAPAAPLGPSRGIVFKLAALFSVDAFAGGFVVQSLLALWLFQRFDLSLAQASVFFFWSNLLAAFSYPVAAWLAARVGLVNTMVFTSRRVSASSPRRSRRTSASRSCCCWCARRCRKWTCRPAPHTSWRW